MSDSLVWHLIRDNNSFLVRRGRTGRDGEVQFSCEPGNIMGVNTFKYSGLANSKALHIASSADAKGRPIVSLKRKVELLSLCLLIRIRDYVDLLTQHP